LAVNSKAAAPVIHQRGVLDTTIAAYDLHVTSIVLEQKPQRKIETIFRQSTLLCGKYDAATFFNLIKKEVNTKHGFLKNSMS
jgi:hypothetical protein